MYSDLNVMLAAERQHEYRQEAERHRLTANAPHQQRGVKWAKAVVTWMRSAINAPGPLRRRPAITDPAPTPPRPLTID